MTDNGRPEASVLCASSEAGFGAEEEIEAIALYGIIIDAGLAIYPLAPNSGGAAPGRGATVSFNKLTSERHSGGGPGRRQHVDYGVLDVLR